MIFFIKSSLTSVFNFYTSCTRYSALLSLTFQVHLSNTVFSRRVHDYLTSRCCSTTKDAENKTGVVYENNKYCQVPYELRGLCRTRVPREDRTAYRKPNKLVWGIIMYIIIHVIVPFCEPAARERGDSKIDNYYHRGLHAHRLWVTTSVCVLLGKSACRVVVVS